MSERPDCAIVGGGVIGLSIAWELASRGMSVTLWERDQVGRGASWAGAGILPPANPQTALDPLDQLRALSHQLHPQWAQRLTETTGIDTGLRRCGGLYLATSSGEAAALQGLRGYWQAYGIEAIAMTAEQLATDEPALAALADSGRFEAAWLLPDEWQLRNPHHLRALSAACRAEGVVIHSGVTVHRVSQQGGHAARLETDQGVVDAGDAVIAGGAWTRQLAASSGVPLDILPVRGQILMYCLPAPILRRIVNEGNRYFVPRADGRLLVGSTEEEVGYDLRTTQPVIDSLRHWAEGILPVLRGATIERVWAGLRPATVDGFPYIGRVPGKANLCVASGHFRSGLHLSCGTAVAVADLLQHREPPVPLDAFRVGRG